MKLFSTFFFVVCLKSVVAQEADTDIEGDILPANTNAGRTTLGGAKGYSYTSTYFAIPSNLKDYDINGYSNQQLSIGSQFLHELLWHISPAGETWLAYGYDGDFFQERIGGAFLKLGTHTPLARIVNRNIFVRTPRFRMKIKTPRYSH